MGAAMKKAYVLLMSLLLLVCVSFFVITKLEISSYVPRYIKDLRLYIQAQILALDCKELAKYFLTQAQKQGKECLNFVEFHYPKPKDIIRIDYFYPLLECENSHFVNAETNLSQNNSIIINVTVLLNAGSGVNEEILVNKKAVIYPNDKD